MPLDEDDEHDELAVPTPLLLLLPPLLPEPNPLDNCDVEPLLLPWAAGRVGTAPVLFSPIKYTQAHSRCNEEIVKKKNKCCKNKSNKKSKKTSLDSFPNGWRRCGGREEENL